MKKLSDSLRTYIQRVERALEQAGVAAPATHGIISDLEAQIAEMRSEEGMSDKAILESLDEPEAFAAAYAENQPSKRETVVTPDTAVKSETSVEPGVVVNPKIVVSPKISVKPKIIINPEKPGKAALPEIPEIVDAPSSDKRGKVVYYVIATLAALTVFLEAVTRTCALTFFDPIPTYFHLALLILTPIALVMTTVLLSAGRTEAYIRWLFFANGFLIAVSGWYTMEFFPMISLAVKAIVFFGLGLLPLSPMLVFVAAFCQGLQLWRLSKTLKTTGLIWRWLLGFLLTAMALGGWYAYTIRVSDAVWQSVNEKPEEREAGLHRLQQLGGEQFVLAQCFPVAPTTKAISEIKRRMPPQPTGKRMTRNTIRSVYYRLTGKDCRSEKMPFWRFAPTQPWVEDETGVGDTNQAIALHSAAYDIHIASSENGEDAGPGTAYAELVLEFATTGKSPEEAKCQLILPPGGVTSRLAVWVDGKERDAVFWKSEEVRKTAKEVVRRGNNQALLTMAGPDRVLLQCFPISSGETMQVKLGFSLPITSLDGQGHIQLPYIAERNFGVNSKQNVTIRAESNTPLLGNGVFKEFQENDRPRRQENAHTLHAYITVEDIANARITVPIAKAPTLYQAELTGIGATSELFHEEALTERLVAVVLDTSRHFEDTWKTSGFWKPILERIPESCKVALFAGEMALPPLSGVEAARQWPDGLSRIAYPAADGQAGNLKKAWDICVGRQNAAVLWIHGTLPVHFIETDTVDLRRGFYQNPPTKGGPTIYSVQIQAGINRIEETLDKQRVGGANGMKRLVFWLDEPIDEGLGRLFANMNYPEFTKERYRFSLQDKIANSDNRYGHIVRLALAKKVNQGSRNTTAALALAAEARRIGIVTQATGAAVLDHSEQYPQGSFALTATSKAATTIFVP